MLGEQFEEFLIIEDAMGNPIDPPLINWKTPINPRNTDYSGVLVALMTIPTSGLGKPSLDVSKLVYEYFWINMTFAAARKNEPTPDDELFIIEHVPVYPVTLVWLRDFAHAFNDPLAIRYFAHPAYDDYPVVGVNWKQATAFCNWRTRALSEYCEENGLIAPHDYRLPTEAEWEYAARGGLDNQMYPWGGPYTYNKQGCYLANFLPQRARYGIDGGARTLPVGSYQPNDYGLFDMAGNVAEWTSSAYDEQAYKFVNSLTPHYTYRATMEEPIAMHRKVVRGGSWKDIAYFLQCGARTYEYQDTTKSYIGFRCVRSYLGR
jgi:gliding motility-associated lipoprotein GldK